MKRYHGNPSEYDKKTLLNKANERTKRIEARQNYVAKMSSKLD